MHIQPRYICYHDPTQPMTQFAIPFAQFVNEDIPPTNKLITLCGCASKFEFRLAKELLFVNRLSDYQLGPPIGQWNMDI